MATVTITTTFAVVPGMVAIAAGTMQTNTSTITAPDALAWTRLSCLSIAKKVVTARVGTYTLRKMAIVTMTTTFAAATGTTALAAASMEIRTNTNTVGPERTVASASTHLPRLP